MDCYRPLLVCSFPSAERERQRVRGQRYDGMELDDSVVVSRIGKSLWYVVEYTRAIFSCCSVSYLPSKKVMRVSRHLHIIFVPLSGPLTTSDSAHSPKTQCSWCCNFRVKATLVAHHVRGICSIRKSTDACTRELSYTSTFLP
jgi:hypothetical protein